MTPRSPSYARWMGAAAVEYDRLLRLLRGLHDEQWRAPTDCEGWDVHDVVAHLVGAAAAMASLAEQVRQARRARGLGRHDDLVDLVDRMNAVQVAERRGATSASLPADLGSTAKRAVAVRSRIPAPVRAVPVPFGPPLGTRPLGYVMGRIYTRDAWMHRVDLARATGSELELTAAHDGAIVEDLVAEWAGSHGAGYDLTLTGPAGGHWSSGTCGPEGEVQMDAVEFARVLSGRSPGDGVLAVRVPF